MGEGTNEEHAAAIKEITCGVNTEPIVKETKTQKFYRRHGINPNLVMLKITLFVMYGATSSLLPYLTIHMQSIGLTVEEIAIIYLALPFTTFLSPPITGFLVDKFGRYKPVVIMSLILNAVFHHSLLMIPQQEIPGKMPSAYVMRHPETGNVEVWWSPCPSRECPDDEELDIIIDQCLDHCLLHEQNPKVERIQPPTDNPLLILDDPTHDNLNFHVSKNKKVLKTESSSTTEAYIEAVTEESEESWVAESEESAYFRLDMHPDLGDPIEQLGMEIEQDDNDTVTDFKTRFGEKLLWKSGVNVTELEEEDLRCGGLVTLSNMSLQSTERLTQYAIDCMVQKCQFRRGGPEICPPDYVESDDATFWIYFVLRFLATTMLSAAVTIMDPIVLTMVEKYGGDFGRERLASSIGMAIFSPITGFMIDYSSRGLGYTNYAAAFYTYDVLLIISAITVFMMPLGEKLPADNVFKDLVTLLKRPHVIIFIFFLFVLGNFWGFIESFLFLYLKELGAPNYLLGITITVGTMSSVPFLYGAERITKIFGHVNLIVIAFIAHSGRLVGYSLIESAWWCFPFEAMEALSCHLMWVAAATYCAFLAPKALLATLIGVLGMAHFSLGRGSGSFIGGLLIGEVGTRDAFQYMGLSAFIGGIAYKLIHYIWLKKFDSPTDEDESPEDAAESGEVEKLTKPGMCDAGTSMSQERLFLMVRFNQIGSLSSLPRGSRGDINDIRRRRSSYQIETTTKQSGGGGSASKVDLLKSALEINHKTSHPTLRSGGRSTEYVMHRGRADSAPKLTQPKHISHPILSSVVDEVSEPSQLSRFRKKHHQSGILPIDPEIDHLHNYLRDAERRDSIPETIPEGVPLTSNLPAVSMEIHDIPEKNENCSCVCTCNANEKDHLKTTNCK